MDQAEKIISENPSKRKSSKEVIFLGNTDEQGYFRFESAYKPEDLEQGRQAHQLESLNSFYRKPRDIKNLHTLHRILIDSDGVSRPLPLSRLDIRERFRELGFDKPPSQIICTSPGRFHVILNLKPLRAFPEPISYYRRCATGLALLFKELGADIGASTNPVGFMRIPGHVNYKYPSKPTVEVVFESDSIFTLSEIYEILRENGLVKKPKAFNSSSDVKEKIQLLIQGKLPDNGSRANNHVCLTLAIYYRTQGLTEEEILEELSDWNTSHLEPLQEREIRRIVRYVFEKNYSLSLKWLDRLTTPRSESSNPLHTQKLGKEPKRVHLTDHADKIRTYLISHGGSVQISLRGLAKELHIPQRSLLEALKVLSVQVKTAGKGRKATSTISFKRLSLVVAGNEHRNEHRACLKRKASMGRDSWECGRRD